MQLWLQTNWQWPIISPHYLGQNGTFSNRGYLWNQNRGTNYILICCRYYSYILISATLPSFFFFMCFFSLSRWYVIKLKKKKVLEKSSLLYNIMYLKQNLKGLVASYAVAAFNAITAITTGAQHLNSTHIWINYIMFFKHRNKFFILFAWSLSGI